MSSRRGSNIKYPMQRNGLDGFVVRQDRRANGASSQTQRAPAPASIKNKPNQRGNSNFFQATRPPPNSFADEECVFDNKPASRIESSHHQDMNRQPPALERKIVAHPDSDDEVVVFRPSCPRQVGNQRLVEHPVLGDHENGRMDGDGQFSERSDMRRGDMHADEQGWIRAGGPSLQRKQQARPQQHPHRRRLIIHEESDDESSNDDNHDAYTALRTHKPAIQQQQQNESNYEARQARIAIRNSSEVHNRSHDGHIREKRQNSDVASPRAGRYTSSASDRSSVDERARKCRRVARDSSEEEEDGEVDEERQGYRGSGKLKSEIARGGARTSGNRLDDLSGCSSDDEDEEDTFGFGDVNGRMGQRKGNRSINAGAMGLNGKRKRVVKVDKQLSLFDMAKVTPMNRFKSILGDLEVRLKDARSAHEAEVSRNQGSSSKSNTTGDTGMRYHLSAKHNQIRIVAILKELGSMFISLENLESTKVGVTVAHVRYDAAICAEAQVLAQSLVKVWKGTAKQAKIRREAHRIHGPMQVSRVGVNPIKESLQRQMSS